VQGNTLSIGDAAATQKECAEPRGLMGQENRYLQALNQAVTFEVEGRNLVFFDGEGIRLVSYRPAG
jgi:heat shock protein HslJ